MVRGVSCRHYYDALLCYYTLSAYPNSLWFSPLLLSVFSCTPSFLPALLILLLPCHALISTSSGALLSASICLWRFLSHRTSCFPAFTAAHASYTSASNIPSLPALCLLPLPAVLSVSLLCHWSSEIPHLSLSPVLCSCPSTHCVLLTCTLLQVAPLHALSCSLIFLFLLSVFLATKQVLAHSTSLSSLPFLTSRWTVNLPLYSRWWVSAPASFLLLPSLTMRFSMPLNILWDWLVGRDRWEVVGGQVPLSCYHYARHAALCCTVSLTFATCLL